MVPLFNKLPVRRVFPMKDFPESLCYNTVLDPNIETVNGIFLLPSKIYTNFGVFGEVILPRGKQPTIDNKYIIDDIAFSMNKLMDMQSPKGIAIGVNTYLNICMASLFGKDGLINRHLFGFRQLKSFRAVLLVDPHLRANEARIPANKAELLGVKENDIVMIKREPVLWSKSIIFMRVLFSTDENVVSLPPQVFKGLAGDCDGDTVSVHAVNPSMLETAERLCNNYNNFYEIKWQDEIFKLVDSNHENPIDMKDYIGLSISLQELRKGIPEDIRKFSKNIQDIDKYIRGLSPEELHENLLVTGKEAIHMKLFLGHAGSLSQKMRLIAFLSNDRKIMQSSNCFAEHVTQTLLSIKHGNCQISLDNLNGLLDSIPSIGLEPFLDTFNQWGFPKTCIPVLKYIYSFGIPFSRIIYNLSPLYLATQHSSTAAKRAMFARENHPFIRKLLEMEEKTQTPESLSESLLQELCLEERWNA